MVRTDTKKRTTRGLHATSIQLFYEKNYSVPLIKIKVSEPARDEEDYRLPPVLRKVILTYATKSDAKEGLKLLRKTRLYDTIGFSDLEIQEQVDDINDFIKEIRKSKCNTN